MPLISQVKYDPLLTNISVEFQPVGRIADQVMPPVPVKLEDGVYWVYDKSKFQVPQALRAPRTPYRQIDWTATRDSYHAEEYGLEGAIDDRERENAASPMDLDETTTEILTENLLNIREKRVAAICTSTTYVTQNTTLAGASQWSDASGGDPIGVSQTAATTIQAATGYLPNVCAMDWQVFSKLMTNAKIIAQLVTGEQLTLQRLAQLFGVEEIILGTALTNTAKKGQTVSLGRVWGKDVLFFYRERRPALKRPSFGYQMVVQNFKAFRYRKTEINSDVIRVNEIRAEKLVAAALGYLVKAAIA
jgi:hypothetical protein